MNPIGTFKVTGGKLVVTDPCYDVGTWCQAVLKNVRNGEWRAEIDVHDFGKTGFGGKRVTRLRAFHASAEPAGPWNVEDFDIGVDSGQAGFFSLDKYPEQDAQDTDFYDTCCNVTLSPTHAGIVNDFGVVSSSGFGDGGYVLRTRKDEKKKFVALEVIFIDEDLEDQRACASCGELSSELDMDGHCSACQSRLELDESEEL